MRMEKKNKSKKGKTQKPKRVWRPKAIPLAVVKPVANQAPRIKNPAPGKVTVTHREFVGAIGTAADDGSLTLHTFDLNPGIKATFPWLGNIACNFETYTFKRLDIEYVPFCNATVDGNIILCVDFDALDAAPTNFGEMMSYQGAVSAPVHAPVSMRLAQMNLKKFTKEHYTRPASVPNGDLKTYDIGKLYVGLANHSAIKGMGSVFVSYDVEFQTPHTEIALNGSQFSAKISCPGATKTLPLNGATVTEGVQEPITVNDGETITFDQKGDYVIDYEVNGTGINGFPLTMTKVENGVAGTLVALAMTMMANPEGTYGLGRSRVSVPADGMKMKITSAIAWTTVVGMTYRLMPYLFSLA